MNILASYRYQMKDHKTAILVYCLIIFLIYIVAEGILCFIFPAAGTESSMNGNEVTSLIFLFVIGLCTFKETFLFSLQNGICRKTLFCAKLLTMASVAVLISAIDAIVLLISHGISSLANPETITYCLYGALYEAPGDQPLVMFIPNFFLECLMAMAVMAVGYFITVLFYRLNKLGKILVGAGVPVLWFIILPLLDIRFFNMSISIATGRLMMFAVKSPSHLIISSILIFAVFCAAAFLLMRRAVVKRQ